MRSLFLFVLLVAAFGGPSLFAQTTTPCAYQAGQAFDFLIGAWYGEEKSIVGQDTVVVSTALVETEPVLGGCALRERWEVYEAGTLLFAAEVLRAYDVPRQQWQLAYADAHFVQQWEGRPHEAGWSFYRDWSLQGQPITSRVTWRPTAAGYEQRIEQSRDGGKTFVLRSWITFVRRPR